MLVVKPQPPAVDGYIGHSIDNAMLLNSGSSQYLSVTPSSTGDRKTWTTSFFVKRHKLGAIQYLFSCAAVSGNDGIAAIYFGADDKLHCYFDTSGANPVGAINDRVYRDVGSFYHIIWSVDAANTTHRIWVNGVEETISGSIYPPNFDYGMNYASHAMAIGTQAWGAADYADITVAEFRHQDGQYITDPTTFGEFWSDNDKAWRPINVTGLTFGTNGAYLPCTGTIGHDESGNSLDWTNNGTVSQSNDSPTKNYATLNPLDDDGSDFTVSNGNRSFTSSYDNAGIRTTFPFPKQGKWYWESTIDTVGYISNIGICDHQSGTRSPGTNNHLWSFGSWFTTYNSGTTKYVSDSSSSAGTNWSGQGNPSAADVIMVAFDADDGKLWFGKNGTWFNSSGTADPAAGDDPRFSGIDTDIEWFPQHVLWSTGSGKWTVNFGQDDFAHTPPDGFGSLYAANLPEVTITDPGEHFRVDTYDGFKGRLFEETRISPVDTIDGSMLLQKSLNQYLGRTPSTTGNRRKFTQSFWVRRHEVTTHDVIFGTADLTVLFYFDPSERINIYFASGDRLLTTRTFTRTDHYYHVVISVDTENADADLRQRLWIDGVEETAFDTRSNIAQNTDLNINHTSTEMRIGLYNGIYADLSIAEYHHLDGTAVTDPNDFGEFYNDDTQWRHKDPTGLSYGENGCYFSFGGISDWSLITPSNGTPSDSGSSSSAWYDGTQEQAAGTGFYTTTGASDWAQKQWALSKDIKHVRIWRPNDTGYDGNAGSATITFTVEGSNTGAFSGEEVEIGSNTATDYDGGYGAYKFIDIDCTGETNSYTYTRVTMSTDGASNGMRAGEIEFFENGPTDGYAVDTAVSHDITPTSDASTVSGALVNITDGDDSTEWRGNVDPATDLAGEYLEFDLGSAKEVNFVSIATRATFTVNYKLQYSDNGSSWTDSSTYSNITSDSNEDSGTFNCSADAMGAHRYWRLVSVSCSSGSSGWGFRLVKLYGSDAELYGLGLDESGQGNHMTVVNGPTHVGDSPTLDYCVWNVFDRGDTGFDITKDGRSFTISNAVSGRCKGSMFVSTGKWYWEITIGATPASPVYGISPNTASDNTQGATADGGYAWQNQSTARVWADGTQGSTLGSQATTGQVVMIALDLDNGKIWYGKDGTWFGSGDPAAGTNAAQTITTGISYAPMIGRHSSNSTTPSDTDFGQSGFKHAPPAGFNALSRLNLPAINNDALPFKGKNFGLGWFKNRDSAQDHRIIDALRGPELSLASNSTGAQDGTSSIIGFDKYGIKLGDEATVNNSTNSVSAWLWSVDSGQPVVDNNGSIESLVLANDAAGFSIVKWTGDGVAGQTVGHGQSDAIELLVHKAIGDGTYAWNSWHKDLGVDYYIQLNTTAARDNSVNVWPTAGITDTIFTLTSAATDVNNLSGVDHIAYCWRSIPGFSQTFSFVGNGSATDGPFVPLPFLARFVMFKKTTATGNWIMLDRVRNTYNPVNLELFANLTNAEDTYGSNDDVDFLSNGLKIYSSNSDYNHSGQTFVGLAVAEMAHGGSNVPLALAA